MKLLHYLARLFCKTDNKKFKYILATGGTGGHVFPAVAVAENLPEMCLIVADKRSRSYLDNAKARVNYIQIKSTKNKFLFLLSLLPSVAHSIRIIICSKAQKIVAFGGYCTVPVLIAAIVCRKKIILHEANAAVGRVNKLFLPFADAILTGLPINGRANKKYKLACNPLRPEFKYLPYAHNHDVLKILIVGGSQGASIFSKKLPQILVKFASTKKIFVTQQCKKDEIKTLENLYTKHQIKCRVDYFFDDIAKKIEDAHLVISRAGAIAITEIATISRPAILIPYPLARDNHQFFNAEFAQSKGFAILLEQQNLEEQVLIGLMNKVLSNAKIYVQNANKFAAKNSVQNLIQAIENL